MPVESSSLPSPAVNRPFTGVPDDPSPPGTPEIPLAELLDRIHQFLRDYVVFPLPEQPVVIALWIIHTWVVEAFDFTPYLHIGSPVKRCGKSTLLDCLNNLCRNPWQVVSPSPPVLFRKIERDCPTLLLDEVDTIFTSGRGDDGKEDTRAVLNAGFQRGAKVPRCVGPTHALAEFSVFCPKALAGIGRLPDTVADRAVPIILARCSPGQRPMRFRRREVVPRAQEIRDLIESWAQTPLVIEALTEARPSTPVVLGDRAADICEPLLALGDLAGYAWPERTRTALGRLCGTLREDDDLGAKLLVACREIFRVEDVDRIPTRELLDKLVGREDDGPWAQWWEADISRGNTRGPAAKLARLLRPFGIVRRDYRADDEVVKGYLLESFADAFSRYLPEERTPTPDH